MYQIINPLDTIKDLLIQIQNEMAAHLFFSCPILIVSDANYFFLFFRRLKSVLAVKYINLSEFPNEIG